MLIDPHAYRTHSVCINKQYPNQMLYGYDGWDFNLLFIHIWWTIFSLRKLRRIQRVSSRMFFHWKSHTEHDRSQTQSITFLIFDSGLRESWASKTVFYPNIWSVIMNLMENRQIVLSFGMYWGFISKKSLCVWLTSKSE